VNLCDRAIWLEKGIIQAIGSAKSVCEKYLAKRYKTSTMGTDYQHRNYEAKIIKNSEEIGKSINEPKRDHAYGFY
jgi:ABC-type glutathione transport system ATPase component